MAGGFRVATGFGVATQFGQGGESLSSQRIFRHDRASHDKNSYHRDKAGRAKANARDTYSIARDFFNSQKKK